MKRILLCGMAVLFAGCATQHLVKVGNTRVIIRETEHGPGKSFVHLHQNETTALKAAEEVVHSEGGRLLTLVHPGERNIVFYLKGVRYEFDPNRMFTEAGIKKTLLLGGHYSPEAHAQVSALAAQVKLRLPPGKIIAVHNNKDYSIKAYQSGQSLHQDAKALYLDPHQFYRNFYLVTRQQEFSRLKTLGYNTVLQAHSATDDGSLSVYLARRDYVNVEAAYGELGAQVDMLKKA